MPLTGIDISTYQKSPTLASWLPKVDFVIVKATEGGSFVDPMHASHVAASRAAGKLIGHYHFARPENNGATTEADFFVSMAGAKPGEVLILDFEPYGPNGALKGDPATYPEWILAFCARVTAKTGAPCWIYSDNNMMSNCILPRASAAQAAALRGQPFWKASYNPTPGSSLGWSALTAWQFTSTPIDQDTFYGTPDTWHALAMPDPQPQGVFMALTDAEQTELLGNSRAIVSQEADRYVVYTGRHNQLVRLVGGIPTSPGVTAADIAAAIPDALAKEVVDALAARLATEPTA